MCAEKEEGYRAKAEERTSSIGLARYAFEYIAAARLVDQDAAQRNPRHFVSPMPACRSAASTSRRRCSVTDLAMPTPLPTLPLARPGWCRRAWCVADAPFLARHVNALHPVPLLLNRTARGSPPCFSILSAILALWITRLLRATSTTAPGALSRVPR